MTPVNLYLFGVNDNARPDGHEYTNTYIWSEADGRRGANNIFLACLKILRSEVIFQPKLWTALYPGSRGSHTKVFEQNSYICFTHFYFRLPKF